MRDHLHATSNGVMDHPEEWRSMVNTKASCLDFPIVFKELLSLAALDLASQIHQPLEALRTLFGAPIETGRQHRRARLANLRKSEVASVIPIWRTLCFRAISALGNSYSSFGKSTTVR
jgi:hypothetical protein